MQFSSNEANLKQKELNVASAFFVSGVTYSTLLSLKKIRVVLLIVSLNWVYCKFDYASHVKEQFTFDSFNNKHFLEPLHHFLNTIFLFSPSHSHTSTLSIVIERRYTSSHHN